MIAPPLTNTIKIVQLKKLKPTIKIPKIIEILKIPHWQVSSVFKEFYFNRKKFELVEDKDMIFRGNKWVKKRNAKET